MENSNFCQKIINQITPYTHFGVVLMTRCHIETQLIIWDQCMQAFEKEKLRKKLNKLKTGPLELLLIHPSGSSRPSVTID